jgi:N-acetylmuramoyl-L-alanine amidase
MYSPKTPAKDGRMTKLFVARASLFLLFSLMFSGTGGAQPSVVVIDPGHGGHDRGGIPGQRLAEKGFTLDTAKRLARVLRNHTAIKVVLTRSDDTFVSLTERTNIANQYAGRNALFVSIHFNAGLREGAYGIETYYNNQRGYRLATLVHPRVIQAMVSIDRGIRHRSYRVLRKNRLPAILVECGFLTNPAEAARITDARSRERLARAIADAILRYD